MIRTLRKRYLLRFKGAGIFSHTAFIAVLFALMNALVVHRGLGLSLLEVGSDFVQIALLLTAVSYIPLRLGYRVIQRQTLLYAVPLSLFITSAATYGATAALAAWYPWPIFMSMAWPPKSPHITALEIAVMTLVVYSLVIQIAVSARRERMARRMNTSNRIKALQARIRPHFFFNTLNSVASLIRSDPDSAEKAIEDLADVFRVVIRADRKLVSLAEEVEIAKQYMNIEKLRLGDRLSVEWHTSEDALNAKIPSLTLQPLLENAVYHGIEPSMSGGKITVDCSCEDERLLILVSNPIPEIRSARHEGSRMALKNIKERLTRQFGGNVRISIRDTRERFNIAIDAPLLQSRTIR
jgi:two-component system, LytTR family, sensor histidine kinase AlgZ